MMSLARTRELYNEINKVKPIKKKIEKAKQLNIKIIKENEWYKILNL